MRRVLGPKGFAKNHSLCFPYREVDIFERRECEPLSNAPKPRKFDLQNLDLKFHKPQMETVELELMTAISCDIFFLCAGQLYDHAIGEVE